MTDLTGRYVWAVLRAVPAAQRPELEPEIRALVADAIEARGDEPDPVAAERAALIELGDPELLAARYVDRSLYLIGPRLFLDWKRILTLLLPIVPPIVGTVVGATNLLGGGTVGEAVIAGLGVAVTVAIQTVFWVTLVFAVIERTGTHTGMPAGRWTPERLPELPAAERIGIGELVGTLVVSVIIAVILVWQQAAPPIVIDGEGTPLFDPALWSFWLPWFLVLTLAEIGFAIALYVRGRWTWTFATVNAVLGAAFAIPAIWLLTNGLLLNPAIVDEIAEAGGTWLSTSVSITAVIVAIVVGWDAIDGFRRANRTATGRTRATV